MATFQPVNTTLAPDSYRRNGEETTPTTPRPSTAPSIQPQPIKRMDEATTPTRASFGIESQRPLPNQPFLPSVTMPELNTPTKTALHRADSQYSSKSEDLDMDSGRDTGTESSGSPNPDGTRSKKKKSQRFYCTEFPPCQLSFTRSEHLARHIRKHTGERPFMCHCSRKFSRLDNLRQHAQTVHQNEEIPGDSLAASGTRFQRQVRTERARPPGSRARAATAGSQPQRGHQRNSSSISSIGSFTREERRRPTPLVMAGSSRLSGEFRPDSPNPYWRPNSPGAFSTPTSATFSTGPNSPHWGSTLGSPITSHSRTQSIYNGHRTPGRRLSVPTAGNPFQSPVPGSYGPPPLSTNMPYSPTGSMLTSPTSSISGSVFGRRESINAIDGDPRRRTWHTTTDSYSGFTSRLQNVINAPTHYNEHPQQAPVVPSNAPPLDSNRLPGINSFFPLPRPRTPHRQPSPMMMDSPNQAPAREYQERPSSQHWDTGFNRNFNRLDIAPSAPPTDEAGSWASDANRAVQAQAEQTRAQPPQQTVRFEESPYSARIHQHQSAPPVTPTANKRHGWYHGPPPTTAAQPPPIDPRIQEPPNDSTRSDAGTASSATITEYNPGNVRSDGYVENRNVMPVPESRILPSNAPNGYSVYPPPPNTSPSYTYAHGQQQPQPTPGRPIPRREDDMSKLEALVAVATNEGNAAAAAY